MLECGRVTPGRGERQLAKLFVVYSKPSGTSGWTGQALEASSFGETWAFTVYAVCATVSSPTA
jgi:hypothetical protein